MKLYLHQEKGVNYLRNATNPALFWEMRLGKSKTVIRAFNGDINRKLIVCPKSVINTWIDELETEGITNYAYCTSEHLTRLKRIKEQTAWFIDPNWMIMNYEAVMKLSIKDIEKEFQIVIIDESVRIKEPRTKVTKFFLQNFRNVKKRVILSGNPAPNNALEYYTQMKFLHGRWMGCDNFWQFRERFFSSDYQGWTWWPRGASKELIRTQLQKDAYILSRKDVGMVTDKIYEKRMIDMPENIKREYRRMEKEFVCNLPSGEKLETNYVVSQLNFLQQLAGGQLKGQKFSDFKIKELVNLLNGELKGEKIVVFCQFLWELGEIKKALQQQKILCESISGKTTLESRNLIQNQFNKSNVIDVLIMQVGTGRFGLNLSAASTVIYYSNSLKPDDRIQSEERIFHPEKKEPLLYVDLITKNSIDEHILKALKAKDRQAKFFLGQIVEGIRERYERKEDKVLSVV